MSNSPTTDGTAGFNGMDWSNVNLTAVQGNPALMQQITCYLTATSNKYSGDLGTRVSAIFVILIISSAATFFPVLAARVRWLRIPIYVYLFARYFGTGVIVATGFIHLLDPAYAEIGPATCVGRTGGWASYSWPPAIALTSTMFTFLLDFAAERYVETRYGLAHSADVNVEGLITESGTGAGAGHGISHPHRHHSHANLHSADQRDNLGIDLGAIVTHRSGRGSVAYPEHSGDTKGLDSPTSTTDEIEDPKLTAFAEESAFRTQIAAFMILEFGVIFHSVIIGLNLGSAGAEFTTLYPVLVFHQSFEGLGVGARLSSIPFPKRLRWMPWVLCAGYGLTTPIAIAIGLGLRTTYNAGSFTASVVSGVLDSLSAGILIFTGLVELLARDFLFDAHRTQDNKRLAFMIICVLVGAAVMALLGKWA